MTSSVVLATAGYDHSIRFWEATSGICYRTLQYPDSQVSCPGVHLPNSSRSQGLSLQSWEESAGSSSIRVAHQLTLKLSELKPGTSCSMPHPPLQHVSYPRNALLPWTCLRCCTHNLQPSFLSLRYSTCSTPSTRPYTTIVVDKQLIHAAADPPPPTHTQTPPTPNI